MDLTLSSPTRRIAGGTDQGADWSPTARVIPTRISLPRVAWSILDCARPSHPPTHWQIFFTRPNPPIASQSISRDVPVALARAFQFLMPLLEGVAEAALYCAHRTSTALPCAFCEQEGHLAAPSPSLLRARGPGARGSSHPPPPLIFSILLDQGRLSDDYTEYVYAQRNLETIHYKYRDTPRK